jgi:nucleoside-triphosphatase
VDLADLERVGVAAIRQAIAARDVVVIDEIGKMELFSPAFRAAVQEAVDSPKPVLGTITFRPHPWADSLKRHPRVQLLVVTLANRHTLAERVVGLLHPPSEA